ncbi:MAG: XisI protein [Saprospiraceae bacterium]|nr:XisI protein [Saprospiraceae bacterium]
MANTKKYERIITAELISLGIRREDIVLGFSNSSIMNLLTNVAAA